MANVLIPLSVFAPPDRARQALRKKIVAFEQLLLQADQVEIPVEQWFCAGVYARQIIIPAGTVLTGKIHKHPCLSIVVSGRMEVVTDEGPKIIEGPMVYESPAGVKRAGVALTECRWITVHRHDGPPASPDEMANLLTVDTFAQLEQLAEPNQERV